MDERNTYSDLTLVVQCCGIVSEARQEDLHQPSHCVFSVT